MFVSKASVLLLVLGLFTLAGNARSQYLGFDRDGDFQCEAGREMKLTPDEPGGTLAVFDLFFRDMPNPLGSVACTFCVHDSAGVALDSFVYHSPEGWADSPLVQNPRDYSRWISEANPNAKCWVAQSSDLTFTHPWESPAPVGTAYFTVAGDEPIHLILDPTWSAYFTVAYATGRFCPGESADSCCCPTGAPKQYRWGAGRTLLR